jgi:hypothetical protein
MRRGFAAAVLVVLAGAVATAAAQAPQRLQASETSQATQIPSQSTSQAPNQTSGAAKDAQPATTSHGLHFITVKFDYDFGKTPACSATVKTACVQEFIAYDISAGVQKRSKLFEIPLPAKPVGRVPGITWKSPTKLDFESGKHLLSVVAREPNGTESKHRACTTWIEIP